MATATLYESTNGSGASREIGVEPLATSSFATDAELGPLARDVSSLRLETDDAHDAIAVLFDSLGGPFMPAYMGADLHIGGNGAFGNFLGNYIQFSEVRSDGDGSAFHNRPRVPRLSGRLSRTGVRG